MLWSKCIFTFVTFLHQFNSSQLQMINPDNFNCNSNNSSISIPNCTSLDFDLDCIYLNHKVHNLSDVVVRATSPERNMTQGEIVFESIPENNGSKLIFSKGFGVDVLYSLEIALGFKIKVMTAKSWATQYPNKTWFGMAQQVIDGEADLSIAKTSILPNRALALSYLVPTHGLGLYAFFVQPASNADRNIFFEPFSTYLWFGVLVTYLILIVSVKIIAFFVEYTVGLDYEDFCIKDETTIWGIHTICQHGFHTPPKLSCLRIALISGVMLGLIVYISYSAQLVSMFSIELIPIKSMVDLLRSKIAIVVDGSSQAAKSMVEGKDTDSDPIAQLLKEHMKGQKKSFEIAKVAGDQVMKAQYAYITFKDNFYTTTKNTFHTLDDQFCARVASVPVTNAKFKSGLFVKKGSYLKEPFNVKMVVMYNAGLMTRFVRKYEETYEPSCDKEPLFKKPPIITLPDVLISFYSLFGAYALCLVVSLAEFFIGKGIYKYINKLWDRVINFNVIK